MYITKNSKVWLFYMQWSFSSKTRCLSNWIMISKMKSMLSICFLNLINKRVIWNYPSAEGRGESRTPNSPNIMAPSTSFCSFNSTIKNRPQCLPTVLWESWHSLSLDTLVIIMVEADMPSTCRRMLSGLWTYTCIHPDDVAEVDQVTGRFKGQFTTYVNCRAICKRLVPAI